MNNEQLKQFAAETPQLGKWVEADSPLDEHTVAICRIAHEAGKRIRVFIHSKHELGSPEFEKFRKDCEPWLGNVELIHTHNQRVGEHAEKSIHVLILNDRTAHAKWAQLVRCGGGQIVMRG